MRRMVAIWVAVVTAVSLGAGPASGLDVGRRAPTSLELTASDGTVRFGDTVRLVASLDGPPRGQAILIERLVGGDPEVIGGCVTGAAGRCGIRVRPRRASSFRAVFAGAGSWDASTSDPEMVRVRADVRGVLRGYRGTDGRFRVYRKSDRVTYVANVAPARRGTRVFFPLEFNYGFGWRDGGTSSFRTAADGRVHIYFSPGSLPRGAYRIRAVTRASAGLLGGASRLAYFRVRG